MEQKFDKLLTAFLDIASCDIKEIKEANHELRNTVTKLLTENMELRNDLKFVNKRLQVCDGQIAQLNSKLKQQEEQIIDLKARSMRENIIIQGIPEDHNESWSATKTKLQNFLRNELKVANPESVKIDRAHRIGQKGKNPRPIVAKLLNQDSRDIIFMHAKNNLTSESHHKVQEQLPAEVTERRKRLWSKFIQAKNNPNNIVKWSLDKLIINGRTFSAGDDQFEIDPSTDLATEVDIKHTSHTVLDGSTFMAHAAKIKQKQDIPAVLATLLQDRPVASATHNIYAYRISSGGSIIEGQKDDGEHGASFNLLRLLREEEKENVIVIVTRWYGNQHLGPKRYERIRDSAKEALQLLEY